MAPTLERSRRWMAEGTALLSRAVDGARDDHFHGDTLLPGWTGRHLLAHLAANAEALGNLTHWARTGEETPMYASPDQRAADIEAGSRLSVQELRDWYSESAARLAGDLDSLTEEQWHRVIRTAQGREVPATEIPWMRAREVMVHAVDLDTGLSFADLPEGFLEDLIEDIRRKRTNTPGDAVPDVIGDLPNVAAYLAGRSNGEKLRTTDGEHVPALPAWL